MRKIYLLLAASLISFSSINAQMIVDENFESRAVGSFYSPVWNNWSLAPDPAMNLQISEDQAASGTKSGFIGNTDQDVFLRFPSTLATNTVTAEWKMYIPEGKFAYYNLQETRTPGESWGYECYSNFYLDTFVLADGTTMGEKMVWAASAIDPETGDTSRVIYAYATIPLGEWFTVKQVFDLEAQKMSFFINDAPATYYYYGDNRWSGTLGTVGGFNFYNAVDDTRDNSYYIDDVLVYTGSLSVGNHSFQKDLATIYPNPIANGIFTIKANENIEKVEIFNILGQNMITVKPNNNSVNIETNQLTPGIYTTRISTKNNYTTQNIVIK